MINGNSTKNFSYVLINRILTTGINGLFWLIMAYFLIPNSYGELTYYVALAGIFSLVSKFGFGHSVIVFQAEKNSNFSTRINFLVTVTTAGAALVLVPINQFAALACIGFSFFSMNQSNLLGLKKYKNFMFNGLAKSILLLTIPFSLYFVLGLPGILLGMFIGDFLCSYSFFRNLRLPKQIFKGFKENHRVLIHNFAVELAMNLPKVADKLLIVPLFGFLLTGIYQFNLQILFALEILPVALHSYLLPEETSGKSPRKIIYLVVLGSILITLASVFLAPMFVDQFFPKYTAGIFSLQILLVSLIPLTFSYIFSAKLQAMKSTLVGFSLIIRLGSLLTLVALLGSLYGIVGLSLAVLISIILYAAFLSILYKMEKGRTRTFSSSHM